MKLLLRIPVVMLDWRTWRDICVGHSLWTQIFYVSEAGEHHIVVRAHDGTEAYAKGLRQVSDRFPYSAVKHVGAKYHG
jgi:hypothetical protein